MVRSQLDSSFDAKALEWVRSLWPGKLIVRESSIPRMPASRWLQAPTSCSCPNHGGRQLDSAPSTAAVLPQIVDAVADRTEIYVDGSVRSGLDVLKFLGLGARACFIGRSYIYGLGAYGQPGVTKLLEILREELDVAMALSGATDASETPKHHPSCGAKSFLAGSMRRVGHF